MEQSPSWKASHSTATHDVLCISCNPQIHYCILQQPATYSYLELHQSSPYLHITSWRSILILSSHLYPGPPHGLLILSGFPTKTLYASLLSHHSFHMHHPFHSSWCDHLNNVCWAVHIVKLLSLKFPLVPCYLVPLGPKYLPFSNTLSRYSSLNMSDQFHTHTKQ